MPSKSKAKGNSWELEVAKHMTSVYGSTFLRVPSSGAFVGGVNSHRKSSLDAAQLQSRKGDIQPPQEWVKFNIECKSYADFPFHQLWIGDVKMLDAWIAQQREVEDDGDLNLIFIKISRKDKWVVYEDDIGFKSNRSLAYKGWQFTSWDDFWGNQHNIDLAKKIATA